MAPRIHHSPLSQHGRRVRMVALELGLDVDWKVVDFGKAENRSADYLALNPMGKVPTLEDDGLVLWESNAILLYLADRKPSALYPTEPKARADVHRWLFWESAHFGKACIALTFERVVKPMMMKQPPEPVLVAAGEQDFARYAAILDQQLAGREYVTGALSLADFAIASMLMYRGPAQMVTSPFPNLERWFASMESRESWRATPLPF